MSDAVWMNGLYVALSFVESNCVSVDELTNEDNVHLPWGRL